MRFTHNSSLIAIAAIMALANPASASAQARPHFDIRSQDLAGALRAFGAATGREVVFADELVVGKHSKAVKGNAVPEQAIMALLRASGLHADVVNGAFVIRPDAAHLAAATTDATQELIVTGTRIRGSAPTGSPIVIVGRDAIDKSGRSAVADILQTIPQNYGGGQNEATQGVSDFNNAGDNETYGAGINLRGLGDNSTLVLFDGVRPALSGLSGSFSDVSLIPTAAIEQIEILTDGASAIYGSDAVAGVVNFRFRNQYQGFETRLRSSTADGDLSDMQASQIVGKRWSGGGVMLAAEYTHRDRLASSDRPFATSDLRPFGGPDNRSTSATPGTITAADGRIFGIPAGQNGTALTAAELIPGQQNRSDQQQLFDLLPEQSTISGYGSIDQALGHGLSVFVRALYARRTYNSHALFYGPSAVTVPVTNAFYIDPIGTHEPLEVSYDLQKDFGTEGSRGSVNALTSIAGLKGTWAGWNVELSGTYGSEIVNRAGENIVNTARLAAALADPDPATAFNVFGDGTANNPATIAAIRGHYVTRAHSQVMGQALRVDGTVLELPAGPAKIAFGIERRDERFTYTLDVDHSAVPFVETLDGLPGRRVIDAAYAELHIPVLSNGVASWFPGQFDISIAGRIEHYTDVGTTRNPKIGASWRVVDGVTLRGSYGTSFRAPAFGDLVGTAGNQYLTYTLVDPRAASGYTNVIALFGLPDKLGPERARSTTFGVDLAPKSIPGLKLSATYFRVDFRDRIATAGLDLNNFLIRRDVYGGLVQDSPSAAVIAAYYANPGFINIANVAASSIGAIVNGYLLNLSRVVVRGIDVDIDYTHALGRGEISAGLSGTRTLGIKQQITPTATAIDAVGMLGSPVTFKGRAHADWTIGPVSIGGALNYTSGYTNQTVTPMAHVKSYVTVDAQIGVTVPASGIRPQVRFALSALNLFDRNPPYVESVSTTATLGYDPNQASPIGRTASLQAIISW
jgi:iron complex outermembrane receptor protein